MKQNIQKRVLLASLVGSAIEWFDYFLYGTVAALVFNQIFFVSENPTIGLMLAYASFALTFFIRPFGGIFFSHNGDGAIANLSSDWHLGADYFGVFAFDSRLRDWR